MAQLRFFQHLNGNDPDFQKVTTLEYIDNSDGMNLYYFKDGSKCNKTYIAPVNANSIDGFEFAEVSSPHNIWKLNYVVPTIEEPKTAVNAQGEVVEIPTWEEFTNSNTVRKPRIDIMGRPIKVENYQAPNDNEYTISAYMEAKKNGVKKEKTFDFNNTETVVTKVPHVETQKPKEEKLENRLVEVSIVDNNLYIHVDEFMKNIKNVTFRFNNGADCDMTPETFLDNALTPKEEKVVEKVVEKEVVVKTSESDIDLGINNEQKKLLDNMIDMSNKTEYPIDLELTLNLPSADIYKLIKTVYPVEMLKGFVNILANRMQIKELKLAVADGLLSFYDDDIETNNSEVEETKPVKKQSSKKSIEK